MRRTLNGLLKEAHLETALTAVRPYVLQDAAGGRLENIKSTAGYVTA